MAAFCLEAAAAFQDALECAAQDVFRSAAVRAGVRKASQVLLLALQAVVCPAPAVADEWAAPDAVRLDVHAKCRAEVHDFPLAVDRDFQKA